MERKEKAKCLLEVRQEKVVDQDEDLVRCYGMVVVFPPRYHAPGDEDKKTEC